MTLTLYYHPLAAFCHKVLVALYENGTAFEARLVDLADEASSAEMMALWPLGKFPVLRDTARERTVPETSVIIEYLGLHHPGPIDLLPSDPDLALEVRLWDRFFDLYVSTPMQKIVGDRLRPVGEGDRMGVEEAKAALQRAYAVVERTMRSRTWAAGDAFSMADCAAAPALFYAGIVSPFSRETHPSTAAYFERLVERPSFARVLEEARPWLRHFPFHDDVPARFLGAR